MRAMISSTLSSAQDRGDYLLGRAAIEAKNAIDAFEAANSRLLGEAFAKLDVAAKANFARIEATVSDINNSGKARLEQIKEIEDTATQLMSMIVLDGDRPYLLRQRPRVIYKQREPIRLVLNGANLDTADAEISTPASTEAIKPSANSTKTQLIFEIPVNKFTFHPSESKLNNLKISYINPSAKFVGRIADFFRGPQRTTKDLVILSLPDTVANLHLETKVNSKVKVSRKAKDNGNTEGRDYAFPQIKGRNEDLSRSFTPDDGWKFDPEKQNAFSIQPFGDGGGNSYCIGWIGHTFSQNGYSFSAHVGEIKAGLSRGDGYVNCMLTVYEYKMEEKVVPGLIEEKPLVWSQPTTFQMPENLNSFILKGKTFDGRETIDTQVTGVDKFFKIKLDAGLLMVTPQIPDDVF